MSCWELGLEASTAFLASLRTYLLISYQHSSTVFIELDLAVQFGVGFQRSYR